MKPKTLAIFTAAVAVVFSLTLWWNHRSPAEAPRDDRMGEPIISPDQLRESTQIRISKGEETFTLSLNENWWQISEYHDLPVNNQHLRALASSLTEGNISRFVTAREDRSRQLGFPGRRWEFRSAEGNLLTGLETGRQTADGRTFFRYLGENVFYLGDFIYHLPEQPEDWIDRQLTNFRLSELAAVTFTLEDGQDVTLRRESPNALWQSDDFPEGSRLKQNIINEILDRWGRIRLHETHELSKKDEYPIKHPSRLATLKFFNRPTLDLHLSRLSLKQDSEDDEKVNSLTIVQIVPAREPHRLHQFNQQRLLVVREELYDGFPLHLSNLARVPLEESSRRELNQTPVSVATEPLSLPLPDEALPDSPTHDSEEE